jgi:DNA-binding HxlR family transcriptional regulator
MMAARTRQAQHPDRAVCERGDVALARAFDVLGQRWTGLVLGHLSAGPAGFRGLSRAIGAISDSMLSTRLTALADAGLVTRTVDAGPPLAVTYDLTDAGRALIPALDRIRDWAAAHLPEKGPAATGPSCARRRG